MRAMYQSLSVLGCKDSAHRVRRIDADALDESS